MGGKREGGRKRVEEERGGIPRRRRMDVGCVVVEGS